MKRIALYFLILIASLLLLDRGIAFCCDYLYKQVKTGQSGGKINYYLSLPQQPELLIMGDSRSFRHTNPDDFPITSYNISHAGMDQSFQTSLLHVLVSQKKIPAYILLQIEPFNYIKARKTPYLFSNSPQQLKYYYDKDTLVKKYIDQISAFESWKYFFESYRYNARLLTLLKNLYQTSTSKTYGNGFEPLDPSNRDSINTIYSSNRKTDTAQLEIDYLQIGYLTKFIEICRNNNIRLICFSSSLFRPVKDDLKYSKQVGSYLSSLHVPYINYIEEHNTLLDNPWYWHDMYHMNEKGAKIESAFLSKEVMRLIH
jgi:hypothetical protein